MSTTSNTENADRSSSTGLLVVVSGPSAVGKDTILDRVLADSALHNQSAIRCVTSTTRQPRAGEVDGVSYHFLSIDVFEAKTKKDGFLEFANNYGNWYGTPRDWVTEQRQAGKDVVMNIDVKGALAVKEKVPDAVLVFISPPSLEELERRLRARNTETEEQIDRRLNTARTELAQIPHYTYCVVNNEIDQAVTDVKAILRAEHCRIG